MLHLHIRIVRTEHTACKLGSVVILDEAICKLDFGTEHIDSGTITGVEIFTVQFIGACFSIFVASATDSNSIDLYTVVVILGSGYDKHVPGGTFISAENGFVCSRISDISGFRICRITTVNPDILSQKECLVRIAAASCILCRSICSCCKIQFVRSSTRLQSFAEINRILPRRAFSRSARLDEPFIAKVFRKTWLLNNLYTSFRITCNGYTDLSGTGLEGRVPGNIESQFSFTVSAHSPFVTCDFYPVNEAFSDPRKVRFERAFEFSTRLPHCYILLPGECNFWCLPGIPAKERIIGFLRKIERTRCQRCTCQHEADCLEYIVHTSLLFRYE